MLPLLRSFEDAEAFYAEKKDPFILFAFLLQSWLGGLAQRAAAEYAEKKHPKDRSLQSGEAWTSFLDQVTPIHATTFGIKWAFMNRFCVEEDSPANTLRRALVPLAIEHEVTGEYFGPKTDGIKDLAARDELQRRTIIRWCDWLESAIHLRTHRLWHSSPGCFAPDPETRHLAALGNAQRHFARMDLRAQVAWASEFYAASQQFKDSPKWAEVGKAMGNDSDRLWQYADVDTLVIALWPLVKAYNWTYRDLLNTIRPALKRPNAYPAQHEQEFATYCVNVLGLRKKGKGASAKSGRPAGYPIAQRLCPALAKIP